MTRHSSLVGGSNADRFLSCPGSWAATMALPPSADVSSEYALEGTAMHAVMDRLMFMRQSHVAALGEFNVLAAARHLVGETFGDRALTQEHLDSMILPALVELQKLEDYYGGDFVVLGVERRVAFPGIPGAFGTIDLIIGNKSHILHIDWKFGGGVGVYALTVDDAGEKLNAQLMFYLAGAKHSCRALYGRPSRETVIAIIQPRAAIPLTYAKVSRRDLQYFIEDMHNAVVLATSRDPELHRGEHCRWCPAKISCPRWTGPMLDLAAMGVMKRTEMVTRGPSPYADYLARAKQLVDMLAIFSKEVNDQLHAYLEDGGEVPGWRLKAKTKLRQWVDADIVERELSGLGFPFDSIWDMKLVTFGKAEAAAKALGVRIPDHLRVAPASTETTVCRSDDPAPPVDRQTAIEQFAASIPLLNRG